MNYIDLHLCIAKLFLIELTPAEFIKVWNAQPHMSLLMDGS
jgi:hypothetical protein